MEIATDNARISLRNDYSEGAHPRLLQALAVASAEVNRGYGLDVHSARAAALIRDRLGRDADVHFLAGGTQTNLVALAAFLRPHEAVIAPASVPVGRYTKAALEKAGLWAALQPKIINTQHVRQSLDYVARGEVDAGFVYNTDAALMHK